MEYNKCIVPNNNIEHSTRCIMTTFWAVNAIFLYIAYKVMAAMFLDGEAWNNKGNQSSINDLIIKTSKLSTIHCSNESKQLYVPSDLY